MQRVQIFERDRYRCVYCGVVFPAEELTVDHVQPRMSGGDHSGGNLVTACKGCNTAKGGRRLSAYLRDVPAAAEHFFALAVHVWPRILRTVKEDMEKASDQSPGPRG